MIMSPELDQLAAALCAAQAEFSAVPKDGFNPHFKSNFAELADVVKSSLPVATKHGLSVTSLIGHDESGDTMTVLILHKSGQYIGDTARLHLVQDNPQSQGSATTYMRRYGYMAALNLVADEDDDGAAATKAVKAYQSRGPARQYQRPPVRPIPPSVTPPMPERSGPMTAEQIAEMRLQAQGLLEKSTVET